MSALFHEYGTDEPAVCGSAEFVVTKITAQRILQKMSWVEQAELDADEEKTLKLESG